MEKYATVFDEKLFIQVSVKQVENAVIPSNSCQRAS